MLAGAGADGRGLEQARRTPASGDAGEADPVAAWVTECLQEGMARYVTRVPVRVEATTAESWAGRASPGTEEVT